MQATKHVAIEDKLTIMPSNTDALAWMQSSMNAERGQTWKSDDHHGRIDTFSHSLRSLRLLVYIFIFITPYKL